MSLVYGGDPNTPAGRRNFFDSCARQLRAAGSVRPPTDQWTTPVLAEDVAQVTLAVLSAPRVRPLLHLGGPERISRADWARCIADRVGAPRSLVEPVRRADGPYASRPENSCLSSVLLDPLLSAGRITVRGAREGTALLLPDATEVPA